MTIRIALVCSVVAIAVAIAINARIADEYFGAAPAASSARSAARAQCFDSESRRACEWGYVTGRTPERWTFGLIGGIVVGLLMILRGGANDDARRAIPGITMTPMPSPFCQRCHAPLASRDRFCPSCGQARGSE